MDDGATDKVFRYSLASKNASIALVTSWSLNTTNTAPTGITLDPSSTLGGDLWVLNNGSTKQVFKYTSGRSVVNTTAPGSSVAFAMSGPSNPQGIADPPPAYDRASVAVYAKRAEAVDVDSASWMVGAGFVAAKKESAVLKTGLVPRVDDIREQGSADSKLLDMVMSSWNGLRDQDARDNTDVLRSALPSQRSPKKDRLLQSEGLAAVSDDSDGLLESLLDLMLPFCEDFGSPLNEERQHKVPSTLLTEMQAAVRLLDWWALVDQ